MTKGALFNLSVIFGDDPKQALRIRRFLMAFIVYVFCAFLGYVSYLSGFMEWRAIAGFLIIIPILNITLYIFFRTGLNLKMADPSLTIIQMSAAIILTTYGMFFANESRGVFLLVYVLILLFGIFRLNTRSLIYISLFTLLTYGVDIVLLHLYRPDGINFQMEYLQFIVFAIVLATFSFIGGYISSLRRNLTISKMEQEKYIETIQEMAIRDGLTGLYNRRHGMELLDNEKNRSVRGGGTFCLAMLDIDHFKNVNDLYGHQAGDAVLQAVAATMKKSLRNTEISGRYGGEEFLIIMTQTDIKGALICAERVRTQIESMNFPDIGPDFKVTVSIGISEYQMREEVAPTIARADEALYQAKKHGRNRVETA